MPRPHEQPTKPGAHDRAQLAQVLSRIDAATPFLTVSSGPSGPSGSDPETIWVADVIAAADDGADPLQGWRTAFRAVQQEQTSQAAPHEHEQADDLARVGSVRREGVPAHVPAAFVLQWWCEVVATPIAYAAGLGPWVLVPTARSLGFEIAAGGYPSKIVVLPQHTSVTVQHDPARRWQQARATYDHLVEPVVRDFAPEIRMSSRQRWGVVDDVWKTAERASLVAGGRDVGPVPVRTSCCFIYVLPGLNECAACPRLGLPAPRPRP